MGLERVCVYCGSSDAIRAEYIEAARAMGGELARRGLTLVFGGGRTGMMGALADAALEAGGTVIGIIPKGFNTPELAHAHLSELRVVVSMHERKARMAEMGDAFVALPGGFGTLEELFEMLTWAQIGLHQQPVGLLNAQRYFDPLLTMIEQARAEGFIYDEHRALLLCEEQPAVLLDRMAEYLPPPGLGRWLRR
ncbi:MAG: TIGR00730 family Rossman fold protein [Chloroflexota bacterium]